MPSIITFNDTATKAVKRLTFFNALTCAIDYMYVDRGVGYYWHPTSAKWHFLVGCNRMVTSPMTSRDSTMS